MRDRTDAPMLRAQCPLAICQLARQALEPPEDPCSASPTLDALPVMHRSLRREWPRARGLGHPVDAVRADRTGALRGEPSRRSQNAAGPLSQRPKPGRSMGLFHLAARFGA